MKPLLIGGTGSIPVRRIFERLVLRIESRAGERMYRYRCCRPRQPTARDGVRSQHNLDQTKKAVP